MKIAYIGNFQPAHSTENEILRAAQHAGHDVHPFQENQRGVFLGIPPAQYDLILWTRTGWNPPVPEREQLEMLQCARDANTPTVGFHLDRWFGLHREAQVYNEPFFRCSTVFTADGGHQADFERAGVNHEWLPPAVSEFECLGGDYQPALASDVAFVGSWRPGYHAEWTHRPELVAHLSRLGDRCQFWPKPNADAVRGAALRNLYTSTKVNVGDSCLSGGATHYWSDRVPETIGRGGFLLHPWVEGIEEHFTDGEHLRLWQIGDWAELDRLIDYYLDHEDERRRIVRAGRAHVLTHHTYTVRVAQILSHVGVPA